MSSIIRSFARAAAIFAFLCVSVAWAVEPSPELGLTPEEIRYIKEHPVVTLGVEETFDPFVHRNEDGSYGGIDVDVTDLISEKTGLEFRFELGKWADLVKRAEQREIDGLTSSIPSPERSRHFIFSSPYARYSSVVLVKKNNPGNIHSLADLAGKRAAVMVGNINMLNEVRGTGEDVDIVWEPNAYELVKSVATGRSDFVIAGEPAFYIIVKIGMAGFIESAFPTGTTTEFCFSLRNDRPDLASIFNKAIKSIPEETFVAVRNKWLRGAAWQPIDKDGTIKLSSDEKEYLSVDHSLGVCVPGDRPPFSFFSRTGGFEGMVADFMGLADESLGPGVKLLPVRSPAPLDGLLENACDLVMMCEVPDHAMPGVSFTTPYLSFPYVVVATTDKRFMEEFLPEGSQTFAVLKGSPAVLRLKDIYPGIAVKEVESIGEGLKQVRDGEVFGLIATTPAVTHDIQEKYLTEIKIIGQTPLTARYAMATRQFPPQLNRIFQKIVGNMGDEEKRGIINKWMAVKYEKGVDHALVWKIVGGGAVLFAAVMYWNRMLGRARRKAEDALAAEREAIRANLNFIDMISHEYRSPLSVITSNLDLIEEKTAGGGDGDVSREVGRMRNSAGRLLNIFESSLRKIRLESASILPDMRSVDIRHLVRAAARDIRAAHPDHEIELDVRDGPPLLARADPELLNVAVLNVLDNACKYSGAGSAVTVSLAAEDGNAVFTARDGGIGIGEKDLERVFEKYFRSQSVGKKRGVGVGLYLVKSIVDLHGGEIRVSSELGKGTAVTVAVPIARKT